LEDLVQEIIRLGITLEKKEKEEKKEKKKEENIVRKSGTSM